MKPTPYSLRRLCSPRIDQCFRTEAELSIFVSVLSLLVVGCATMNIPEAKVRATESYQLKAEQRGLLVAVRPVTDENEIKETFGTALLEEGILPVLVVTENRNPSTSFIFTKDKVAVVNREALERDASQRQRVASDTAGPAMATAGVSAAVISVAVAPAAVIALPLVIGGLKMSSDAQVIEHSLREKEFYSRTVGPAQKAYGYVYFHLPQGTTTLDQHHVLVEAIDSSTGEAMIFDFPINYSKR
jgi:hypothetical protein